MSFPRTARPDRCPVPGSVSSVSLGVFRASLLIAALQWGLDVRAGEGPGLLSLLEDSNQSTRSLAEFVGSAEAISLSGSQSAVEVEIPLNPRMELEGGEIRVHFAHASGLDPERSRITVSWNGVTLGSRELGSAFEEGFLRCRIPAMLPSLDSVDLRIEVAQRLDGSFSGAKDSPPVPWTLIDPARSRISLNYQFGTLSPNLDEIRGLIDATLWEDYRISLVTAPIFAIDDRHLDWGKLLVQRTALWLEERPLRVRHGDRLSSGSDEVAIGTRDELIGILPQGICDRITNSFLGVYPHPENPRHFLLVLSGAEPEGVDRAVRAFVFASERLPPMTRVDVTRWEHLPSSSQFAISTRRLAMPDLREWAQTGLPAATQRNGFSLWIPHRNSQALASAWMLAAKWTQVSGDMVSGLEVVSDRPGEDRHWLALGARRDLPPEVLMASPYSQAFREGELMGRQGMLAQFESPFRSGRVAGLLTADDRVLLEERVSELVEEDLWTRLHGDTVTWQGDADSARFRQLAPGFEVGEISLALRVWRWLVELPWLSVVLGGLGAGIVTWLLLRPVQEGSPVPLPAPSSEVNQPISHRNRFRIALRRLLRIDRAPPPSAG